MFSLRLLCPSLLDTASFSCRTLSVTGGRCFRNSAAAESADNKNIKFNPVFENRNPRALESMGIVKKTKGWKYQSPRKDFYHKLIYDKERMYACVQHSSGRIVVEASSREPTVMKYLHSPFDVSASWNIGQLLARRMLESGITDVFYDHDLDTDKGSEKKQVFLSALKENHIELREVEEVKFEVTPGINYEGYNRYAEKRKYQDDYQKL